MSSIDVVDESNEDLYHDGQDAYEGVNDTVGKPPIIVPPRVPPCIQPQHTQQSREGAGEASHGPDARSNVKHLETPYI